MRTCATCGQQISPSIGECLYCPPVPAAGDAGPIVPDLLRPPPLAPAVTPPAVAAVAPPAAAAPAVAAAPVSTAPPAAPTAAPPAPVRPSPSGDPGEADALQQEAEEALSAGAVERALVLASRVVKQRPQSVAARSLYERARRELLRGLRRERLEARVREAERMMEAGDFAGAERIVTSALKLLPDHPMALDLFGKLKARRLAGATAEAEAERELQQLGVRQSRQALAAAHTAIANGWERRALLAVRRGLRVVPDDPELLALLRELQGAEGDQDPQRAHRSALRSQVRAAIDLLRQRKLEDSLAMLRAVLREDPDNARAQEAVQQVRRAWLRRTAPPIAVPAVAVAPVPAPSARAEAVSPSPARASPAAATTVTARSPAAAPPARPPARAASVPTPPPVTPAAARASVPATSVEPDALRASAAPATALLTGRFHVSRAADPAPPARRPAGATLALLVGGGAAAVLAVAILMSRDRPAPPAPAVVPSAAAAPATPPAAGEPATPAAAAETRLREPPGPLAGIDPNLRRTVEETLAAYGEALEAQDEARLARARPDLSARQRAVLLAPFKGALNVATDLRVVEVTAGREDAQVTVLRTDVIVDGRGGARAPVEEALRFVRRGGAWTLGGAHR